MDWDPLTHYQEVAVAERYDQVRFSSLAGKVFNTLEKACIRRAFADVPRSCTILDAPCGTGRFAEVLLEQGFNVVGVDISEAMLEVARRKLRRFGARFQTRLADIRTLGEVERLEFDHTLCARVLMHFPLEEQIQLVRRLAKVTNGQVVLTQSLSTPYQRLRRRAKRLLRHQPSSHYPITEMQLRALLQGAGLREVARMRVAPLVSEALCVVAQAR